MGALQLTHDQFYSLTVREFNELVEAYQWREQRKWEENAVIVATLISPHVKKGMAPKKLLSKWGIGAPSQSDKVEKFEKMKQRLENRQRKAALEKKAE